LYFQSSRQTCAFLTLIALAILACSPAGAQSSSDAMNDRELIQQLVKRIEELETTQKLTQERLERLARPAPAVEPASVAAPVTAMEAEQASAATESEKSHVLGPLQFRGFTDINYGRALFEKLPPAGLRGSANSFNVGDFDLFTNTRISDHWSVLGEMLVTSDFTNNFGIEMDRLLVSYTANDFFKLSFGKYNTAIGYYPNAFHRARYFQTATGRPLMFSDEDNGGILPVHSIGFTATGKIPSGSLGLHWVAETANGRSSHSEEALIQNFVDENNGKAVNLALYARPEWLHGFQTGFSIYRDLLHPEEGQAIRQTISSAHIVYIGSKFEWLNEAALIRHSVKGENQIFRSTTAYTQFSQSFGKTRPFVRYEYQNVPKSDPILHALGRRGGPSFGVSRHLSSYAVLKVQFGRLQQRGSGSVNDFQTQLAFAF